MGALRGDERHGAPSALEGAVAASRIGLEEEGKEKGEDGLPPSRTSRSMITAAPFMTRARVIAPCVQLMTRPTHGSMAAVDVQRYAEGGKATTSGPRGNGIELTQEAIDAQAVRLKRHVNVRQMPPMQIAVTDEQDLQGEEMSAIEGRLQVISSCHSEWIAVERDAGDSYGVIVKRLNAEHIPTPSGRGVWHKEAVRRLYQKDREQLMEDGRATLDR